MTLKDKNSISEKWTYEENNFAAVHFCTAGRCTIRRARILIEYEKHEENLQLLYDPKFVYYE